MPRRVDPRYCNNVIDANILDRFEDGHDEAVDAILALHRGNMVGFQLPYSVKAEIDHPHTPIEVKERAREFIFTEPVTLTANEHALHAKVRELIRGNAAPGQHDQDALHLFEAEKYGGGYFVTRDRRLLRKRAEIERLLERGPPQEGVTSTEGMVRLGGAEVKIGACRGCSEPQGGVE